jgi:Amt family ammonium transporter
MPPHWAIVTGLLADALVLAAQSWIERRGWDDVVGAVAVHGLCGVWGRLAAGLFHQDGLFDPARIAVQLVSIATAFLWTFPLGWVIFKALAAMGLLRASVQDQQRGLDYGEHAEIGYPEFQRDLLHAGRSEV